jgi:hypothetical protein
VTGACHCDQLLFEMGSRELFAWPGWSQTVIHITASQTARITSVNWGYSSVQGLIPNIIKNKTKQNSNKKKPTCLELQV